MHVGPFYASTHIGGRRNNDALIGCLGLVGIVAAPALVLWNPVAMIPLLVVVAIIIGGSIYAHKANHRALSAPAVPVDAMTGAQFERLVADLMALSGYRDVQVRGGRGDGGVDIIAVDFQGSAVAVQCKRYAGAVGVGHVRDFLGALGWGQFAGYRGMLVTSGSLTVDGLAAARGAELIVVARPQLNEWLGRVYGSR